MEVLVQQTIPLYPNQRLDSHARGRVYRAAPNFRGPMFQTVQPNPNLAEKEIQGIHVSELSLIGNGQCIGLRYGADPAVVGSHPRSCHVEGFRIEECAIGILVEQAEGGHFQDGKLIHNTVGVKVGAGAAGLQWDSVDFRHNQQGLVTGAIGIPSNEWLWNRCHWESHPGLAVLLSGCQKWQFNTCKWEGNGGHVVLDTPDPTNVSLRPDGHCFINPAWNKTVNGQVGVEVRQGNNLVFLGPAASSQLAVALDFAGPAGWWSVLLGGSLKRSQVRWPNFDHRLTCIPELRL